MQRYQRGIGEIVHTMFSTDATLRRSSFGLECFCTNACLLGFAAGRGGGVDVSDCADDTEVRSVAEACPCAFACLPSASCIAAKLSCKFVWGGVGYL